MGTIASSEFIFFITATAFAASAATAVGYSITDMADGVEARGHVLADTLASGVLIVNDPRVVPTSPFDIHVKNIGTTVLHAPDALVTVDGRIAAPTAITLARGAPSWAPADVATFRLPSSSLAPQSDDHVVTVSVESGRSDTFRFRAVAS